MTSLKTAVHPLIRSHLKIMPDGNIGPLKPLLTQLMEARGPDSGQARKAGNEQHVPINVSAVDLWAELEDDARSEQCHRTRDDSGVLRQILDVWAELEETEREEYLAGIAVECCVRIEQLIDPTPKQWPFRHKCPA